MNENVNKRNSIVKSKSPVWEIKVGVFAPVLIKQSKTKTETKLWKTKVILN